MNTPAITLKIKSIFDWIASNVSTQKLYGLWMTDLVMGGSLLKILNGAPITKIKSRNGMDRIKIKLFLIEKFMCGERGIRTLDTLTSITPHYDDSSNLSTITYWSKVPVWL